MPFPDAVNAIVEKRKLLDYLLNAEHPIGGSKAEWFASVGYHPENWQDLQRDLQDLALSDENFIPKPSPYGVKYETRGAISIHPHRPGLVVAVWMVEGNSTPRLVTAYPE